MKEHFTYSYIIMMAAYINYKFSSLNYLTAKSFEKCHFSHDNPTGRSHLYGVSRVKLGSTKH